MYLSPWVLTPSQLINFSDEINDDSNILFYLFFEQIWLLMLYSDMCLSGKSAQLNMTVFPDDQCMILQTTDRWKIHFKSNLGTSLLVHWLKICRAVQGMWFLVGGLRSHNAGGQLSPPNKYFKKSWKVIWINFTASVYEKLIKVVFRFQIAYSL